MNFTTTKVRGGELLNSKRILVADDELDECFMLQRVLAGNSNIADSFEDPFLALKRFRAQSYNLCPS
jgi:CheY-like chemotaxis protein